MPYRHLAAYQTFARTAQIRDRNRSARDQWRADIDEQIRRERGW